MQAVKSLNDLAPGRRENLVATAVKIARAFHPVFR
jgi:hypothetical protein